MEKIENIAKNLKIPQDDIYKYGEYIAKINYNLLDKLNENKDGKLILVTSINPTPLGEGKTTQSIGLAMAMNKINKNTTVVLREPSLGPVFGIKGGAVGGGKSIVEPSEDINLHFTGDFHAITSANNLLCAVLDNHIFQGNNLNIDVNSICIKRVIDMNDRALRNITIGVGSDRNGVERNSSFEITSACEIMAICDLALNMKDLKLRLENILVAYDIYGKPVFAKELNCINAMLALLKNTINPNLIQTKENTPCIMHLGPFANIAHGCNSIIATKLALKLSDYVVTEAGFGADLGAEKFFDIKCRIGSLVPDLAMIVATTKALKYNANIPMDKIGEENVEALKKGICNLDKHIENVKKYGVNVICCINKYENDYDSEINFIKKHLKELNVECEVSTSYSDGSNGAINLAKLVCNNLENNVNKFKYLYEDSDTIISKIYKVSNEIYGAKDVLFLDGVKEKIKKIEEFGFSNLPICIAKTPLSLSDNPKILGRPQDFSITVKDVKVNSGAGFIVVYTGNIMTMPGLGKKNKYEEF